MRKLKLQMQISVDGYVAGPNGEMDWMVWDWDDGLMEYVSALTEPVDLILLGRKLAEGFIPAWKERSGGVSDEPEAFVRFVNETPKVVFSRTLDQSDWENATLAKGDLAEEIGKLKAASGGDIIAYGGGEFVSDLIRNGLIDEYHLFVNPAAIGGGMSIFREQSKAPLKLVSATPFECGIVALFYAPAG
ncbi:MAG: dihydrofolate reductase [Dehalococcoidia bacterium]|nr:dihydrofolate reductase [Dehalococcoidia bacterium]